MKPILYVGYFLAVTLLILQGVLMLLTPQKLVKIQNAWYRLVRMPNRVDTHRYDAIPSRIAGAITAAIGVLMLIGLFLKIISN